MSSPPLWLTSRAVGTGVPPPIRVALGPLAETVGDPRVTDVFVTSSGQVFADTGEGAYVVPGLVLQATEARELARHLIEHGGRNIHPHSSSPQAPVGAVISPSRPCRVPSIRSQSAWKRVLRMRGLTGVDAPGLGRQKVDTNSLLCIVTLVESVTPTVMTPRCERNHPVQRREKCGHQ